MAIYYIDNLNGSLSSDGKSPENARKSEQGIDVKPGDKVLFKRGSFIRGAIETVNGTDDAPVTYGAYGEGRKPIICGSVDLGSPDFWTQEKPNLWKCTKEVPTEAGNFIFNNGKECGTLRWSVEELVGQGDFFDSRFGITHPSAGDGYCTFKDLDEEQNLYLYSEKNPGEYYSEIECAIFGKGCLAKCERNIIFENLSFQNCGVHGICGSGINVTIRNCDFTFIGGAVIIREDKIRFGNGVEFWNICENCSVENCYFYNIYDSAITHQGKVGCRPAVNSNFDNNFIAYCGMAAYECRDFIPINTSFNNNTCINAGEGFSKLGEEMPRASQIYPLPMGHHVFIWRIDKPTDGGSLEIKGNKFINAPYGAAIFSMASEDATEQMAIDENTYFSENTELCNYFYGNFFSDFDTYQKTMKMDLNGKSYEAYYKEVI